jgi:hypothetical protein
MFGSLGRFVEVGLQDAAYVGVVEVALSGW